MTTFRLHAMGGLANRLRTILSYRAVHGSIVCEWDPTKETAVAFGHFLDVFEPIQGVTFETPTDAWETVRHDGGVLKIGDITYDNDPHREAPMDWTKGYLELQLRPEHAARLPKGIYDAMHIRRTDLTPMAASLGNLTPDDEFFAWARTGWRPVWLATDNGTTQLLYQGKLKELGRQAMRLAPIQENERQDEHDFRNTTLADAAIDLFACSKAVDFKGTRESSFTLAIELLRRLRAAR